MEIFQKDCSGTVSGLNLLRSGHVGPPYFLVTAAPIPRWRSYYIRKKSDESFKINIYL